MYSTPFSFAVLYRLLTLLLSNRPGGIPAYQNMLNLPNFNDPPPVAPHLKQRQPDPEPQQGALPPGPGEGVFTHAQYNSPLQLYSNDAVGEAFKGQTGGVVTAVKRYSCRLMLTASSAMLILTRLLTALCM